MTEQELKPLVVQLYTQFLTMLDAKSQGGPDLDEIAEFAERLWDRLILGMKQAGELDELLSLSPEEVRDLFNQSGFANNDQDFAF
jgi:hypothetical protein